MTSTSIRPEFPPQEGAPVAPRTAAWRSFLLPLSFLAPAIFFLAVWMIYPTIYTAWRSLYSDAGGDFVGIDNYRRLFSDDIIFRAIRNNALWVLIVPALVTAVGLVFAVLTERVRWATAFKIVVFMPLAVSLFAVGVIWRLMYQEDPERGALNAAIVGVQDAFSDQGVLTRAQSSTDRLTGSESRGFTLERTLRPGETASLGLTGIRTPEIPEDAKQAKRPEPVQGGISGVVWRDFKPGGGKAGVVESDEVGLPGISLELRSADGKKADSTTSGDDGSFRFDDVGAGTYRVAIAKSTFAKPFNGFNWLGDKLITPAIMFAYIWVTAGFAMVIIAAGLSAIPRDVLEAARTDGGSEWQVFRRVTVPLLAPVLTVVFVTQIIGVLKIFDLILAIAPAPSRNEATVIAFEMWRRAFSGQLAFGLGSAIATFLFLLFIPMLVINVRRFRAETR